MSSIRWQQTGGPFPGWTAFQNETEIGSVEFINDNQWEGTRVGTGSKTFFSREAARQWVEFPDQPLIEEC